MKRNALIFCIALCACDLTLNGGGHLGAGGGAAGSTGGGSNDSTPVIVDGQTLTPNSTAASFIIDGLTHAATATAISITDHSDICSTYGCAIKGALPARTAGLYFVLGGSAPQEYQVAGAQADAGAAPRAVAQFIVTGADGGTSYTDTATSGRITLDLVAPATALSGSYELTMAGGPISGRFSASWCDAIRLTAVGDGVVCDEGNDTNTSCTNSCTCNGKTVSSSCTFTGSTWNCRCQAPSGAISTCSVSMPSDSLRVCYELTNCCPFNFKG